YVGNHALRLVFNNYPNQEDRLTGLRPNPGIQNFRYLSADDASNYQSLQVSLRQRLQHDLTFNLNYTWSHTIGYADGDLLQGGNGPQEPFNRSLEKGPVPTDIHHRLTTDFIYELPLGLVARGGGKPAEYLLKGWQVAGIFSAQSGGPLTLSQGRQIVAGQRPDYLGDNSYLPNYNHYSGRYLNPAAFAPVALSPANGAVRPGTLGRGALRGIASWNLDLSMAKNMKLAERTQLQLR